MAVSEEFYISNIAQLLIERAKMVKIIYHYEDLLKTHFKDEHYVFSRTMDSESIEEAANILLKAYPDFDKETIDKLKMTIKMLS